MKIKVFTFSKRGMSNWKLPAEEIEPAIANWLIRNPQISIQEIKHDSFQAVWTPAQLIVSIYYSESEATK